MADIILQVGYLLYDINVCQKLCPLIGRYANHIRHTIFAMHYHRSLQSQQIMIEWLEYSNKNVTGYLQGIGVYNYKNMTSILGDVLIDKLFYAVILVNDSPYGVEAILRRMKSQMYIKFDKFSVPLEFLTWAEFVNPKFTK